MNNQAAQTMPELPVAIASIHADGYWTTDDRRPDWKWPARQRVFSVDQMHQYARDYAAMLAAAPAARGVHPDALPDGTLSKSTAKRVEALVASGGEDGWSLAMRVREALDRASCPDHFMRIAVETITGDAPHPPAAASVSERARELLAAQYRHDPEFAATIIEGTGMDSVTYALRAITAALTQQRGECWPLNKNPKDGWTFDPSFLDEVKTRAEQSDIGEFAPCLEGVESVLIALRGMGDTTPQPSADAVREIYDAAAKGFHTSETNGSERKYLHVIRFQSIEDLHCYEDAWTAAMVKARDAK